MTVRRMAELMVGEALSEQAGPRTTPARARRRGPPGHEDQADGEGAGIRGGPGRGVLVAGIVRHPARRTAVRLNNPASRMELDARDTFFETEAVSSGRNSHRPSI